MTNEAINNTKELPQQINAIFMSFASANSAPEARP